MLICQGAQACGNLTEGTLVMIQGPRHRTDLNGHMGEVISWNRARGRYTMSIGENDSTLNVRSENLRRRAQGMARRMCRRPSGAPSAWRAIRRRMSSSPTPQRYTRPAVSGSRSWENAWPGGAAAQVQLSGDETQWVLQQLQCLEETTKIAPRIWAWPLDSPDMTVATTRSSPRGLHATTLVSMENIRHREVYRKAPQPKNSFH